MAGQSDLLQVLSEQNPWHRTGEVPHSLARTTERVLGRSLWSRLTTDTPRRFHLVLGSRRVGKTTALYQTARHLLSEGGLDPYRVWWLRLDHPQLLRSDLGSLIRLIVERSEATATTPVYLLLDEIVYADDWDLWLKTFYDDLWPVRIAATSSATAALRDRRRESGVGRWTEQFLTPYSFGEFLDLKAPDFTSHIQLIKASETLRNTLGQVANSVNFNDGTNARRQLFMLVGGFPEILSALKTDVLQLADELLESQQILRTDAVERAVYKDIPQTFGVDNPMLLERLLYVLAAQMTGVLSPTKLSKELERGQPTVDRYLSYLEQAFLVFTLTNYSGNETSIQKRGRKLFFFDGAIRNAALQRGLRPLVDVHEQGALLENLVAATLRSVAWHTGSHLHFWREKSTEVDFVLDQPGAPLAIEIGSSDSHSRAGLQAFQCRYPEFEGGCWLVTPDSPVLQPSAAQSGIGSMPLNAFLLAASAQADRDSKRRIGVV